MEGANKGADGWRGQRRVVRVFSAVDGDVVDGGWWILERGGGGARREEIRARLLQQDWG